MSEKYNFNIVYKVGNKKFSCTSHECEHFSLSLTEKENILSLSTIPKTPVSFDKFDIIMPYTYSANSKIYVNGYQSWTDSMEYEPSEQMLELSRKVEFFITKSFGKLLGLSKSGDTLFWKFPRKSGLFYGWSYGYVRTDNNVDIFGTLTEKYGYTVVTFDCNNSNVIISKELEGVTYTEPSKLLEFTFVSGEYDTAFDEYFKLIGIPCRETKRRCGYTTWYNYYGNINEKVVNNDLDSIINQEVKFDCFQIDDGYQQHIGDWLITDKNKFPNGMKVIADKIHDSGMIAGLWLAPFAGVPSSELFKNHPDWFIKDKKGKPYKTGHNWGGFYSLDIYNQGARAYIKQCFDVVLNEWGYDLVKLDFLYGACVLPMHNKSRGEIMTDAMDFIRECVGDKMILGCGVPMFPAFGKVDYCRIGADIQENWINRDTIREDCSTPHATSNTIFRRHLNGRAWMNDPDVFFLREENMKMTFEKRLLIAKINSIFGSLLFISDDIKNYNNKQKQALIDTFGEKDIKVQKAEFIKKDIIQVVYSENGENKSFTFNIRDGQQY